MSTLFDLIVGGFAVAAFALLSCAVLVGLVNE